METIQSLLVRLYFYSTFQFCLDFYIHKGKKGRKRTPKTLWWFYIVRSVIKLLFYSLSFSVLTVISSSPTMKFLCATVWEKPQKCLGAGAGDVMDSWVWGFAGKPWVSDMDRLQVSMANAHKQEETLRESRYFTAWEHYKHPERGRKPLSMLK